MELTTVCLIDDHAIVRQGLKELLMKMNTYQIIYEFNDGDEFLNALPLEKRPDIYILDYSMPHKNGIEVLQELGKREEEYRVLLLTQHFDEHIINSAYHHGARGFLHKNCSAHDLKFAIDNIVTIGYNNISEILKRIRNFDVKEEINPSHFDLSTRELEFLTLVCDERELTYEQMADIMKLSVKSIEVHRASLFEKFNIKSKVGLVLFSFKYKLTEPFI